MSILPQSKPVALMSLVVLCAVLVAGLACGADSDLTATPSGEGAFTPSLTSARAQTPTDRPPGTLTPPSDDSTSTMFRLLRGFRSLSPGEEILGEDRATLHEVLANRDTSLVPSLIELLRFNIRLDFRADALNTLQKLTGQQYGPFDWIEWMVWLGRNSQDFRPPEGYMQWKAQLLARIDPRYLDLLPPGVKIRIDPVEVVWGGVLFDGIPDLRNPHMLSAKETKKQGYPLPDDRVFGVSINGDTRAYPLRVANRHEMVNDVVGGEPIALAY